MTRMKKKAYPEATIDTSRVNLYPDGKYRWVHDVNMYTNPTVLIDVLTVLGMSLFIIMVFAMGIGMVSGAFSLSSLGNMLLTFVYAMLLMTALGLIGYLLYAVISGGKYTVLFIMDEKEIVHKQMPKTVKKAQLIGKLTMLAGLASGRPGMMGMALLIKDRTSMTTAFADVKRLSTSRWMHLIRVDERLSKNRVYVPDEDFDFVLDFLSTHCPNAKKRF